MQRRTGTPDVRTWHTKGHAGDTPGTGCLSLKNKMEKLKAEQDVVTAGPVASQIWAAQTTCHSHSPCSGTPPRWAPSFALGTLFLCWPFFVLLSSCAQKARTWVAPMPHCCNTNTASPVFKAPCQVFNGPHFMYPFQD